MKMTRLRVEKGTKRGVIIVIATSGIHPTQNPKTNVITTVLRMLGICRQ